MNESSILRTVLLAVTQAGARAFRNNIGSLRDETGRYVTYGVCNPGGSDLIGWTKDGRFLAIEVKTETGHVTQDQQNFLCAVNRAGGLAFVARSAEEALAQLK